MTWIETVPTLMAGTLIIFVPGAILAKAIGARGLTWLGFAAPLSVSLAVLGPIAASFAHIRWNPLILALLTLGLSALAWVIRRVVTSRSPAKDKETWNLRSTMIVLGGLGGLAFGGSVITVRFMKLFISPSNISQTYDNVYHLSAIRAILDSGNGSALDVGSMVQNGPSGVYPFAWHNLVALTAQITNVSIPVAVNSTNVVIGALVWTVSSMYLASRVAGTRPAVLLMTGIMAGAFGAFPYIAVGWGVLYPNFLAIALFPAFIGLVTDILKISVSPRPGPLKASILLVLGVPGLALAHPNILMALGAFSVPLLLFWLIRCIYRSYQGKLLRRFAVGAGLGFVIYLAVLATVWLRIRPSVGGSHWPPVQSIPVALREALATSPLQVTLSWPVLVLTVLGILVVCVKRRQIWLLGPYLVGVMFFVVSSSFPVGEPRQFITGVFFNDSNRLAAMLPVIALPLTVVGSVGIFDLVRHLVPVSVLRVKPVFGTLMAAGVVAGILVGVSAQNNAVQSAQVQTSEYYSFTPNSWLLSTDEYALIVRAAKEIPANATVIGHPASGASLIYALEGLKTIMPAISSIQSPEVKTIFAHLPELEENPAVCQAIRKLDAYYILDFDSGRQVSNMKMTIPSSGDLAMTPGLTLLDQEGPAKLYRIDVCQ